MTFDPWFGRNAICRSAPEYDLRHGLAVLMNATPTSSVISLFSGAGFLDLGFEDSGFDIALANEFNPEFARAYCHARNSMARPQPKFGVHIGSVEALQRGSEAKLLRSIVREARDAGRLIGVIGGPPCPDFSVGGKNRGADGDNGRLSRVFFELIAELSPDWFVFENVRGLFRTRRHRQFFEEMRALMKLSGFSTSERLINAIEYGAAQDRDRIIMFGVAEQLLRRGSELSVAWDVKTVFPRSVLVDVPWPVTSAFGSAEACPVGVPTELTVSHWFSRNDVASHPNAHHRFNPRAGISRFRTIEEGDDARKSFKRLHRFRYSPTACYGNNEVHLHPTEARRISVAEALALQSLPAEFELPGDMTLSDMFKTIGNGVPYLAARGIAQTVSATLDSLRDGVSASDLTPLLSPQFSQ